MNTAPNGAPEVRLYGNGQPATKARTLPSLFLEMEAADLEGLRLWQESGGKQGRDPNDTDFFPVKLPSLTEDGEDKIVQLNERVRERIIALFVATVEGARTADKRLMLCNYYPVPGEVSPYCDSEDLAIAADSAGRLMDPRDPEFHAAIADRQVGVLRLLAEVLNFLHEHENPTAAFKYLQIFGRPVQTGEVENVVALGEEGGIQHGQRPVLKNITELPWEQDDDVPGQKGPFRASVLKQRFQVMETVTYKIRNQTQIDALNERFKSDRGTLELLLNMQKAFETTAVRLKISARNATQWFNVLINSIAAHVNPQTIDSHREALTNVLGEIQQAQSREALRDAIESFAQKLPSA